MLDNDRNLIISDDIIHTNDIIHPDNINHIIDKFVIICNYNSNLHILSHQYFDIWNLRYIYTFMIMSFLSGIAELINFNTGFCKYIPIIIGIINICNGIFLNHYKDCNLGYNSQAHFNFFNSFEKIKLKVEMNSNLINTSLFIYKDVDTFIKEINNEIGLLFITRPIFPSYILNEYQINKSEVNNKNQVIYNTNTSMLFSVKKSFNIIDIAPINDVDREDYNNFLDNIKYQKIEKIKERYENLIHFK